MKAFILAGGEGKRLRPYTAIFPKPLLPINGKPILEIILKNLKDQGVDEAVLGVNYKSEYLEMYFQDGSKFGMKLSYSKEDKPLGTIGPLKLLEGKFDDDFLVMNGDILTDLDINSLLRFHKKNKPDITVVTKKQNIDLDYGMIESKGNNIVGWKEKPQIHAEISTGIYMLNPKVIKYIPKGVKYDMPSLVQGLINNKGIVKKFLYNGRWMDIGRISDYESATEKLLEPFKKRKDNEKNNN